MKRVLLAILLAASCSRPLTITTPDAGAECRGVYIEDVDFPGGCRNCAILVPVPDVDILTVWIDGVKLWPSAWHIDEHNCLVWEPCDGRPHAVMVETACWPPRSK
jgi:hypothetical protein